MIETEALKSESSLEQYLRLRKRNKSLRPKTVRLYRLELGLYEKLKDNLPELEAHLDACALSTRSRKLVIWKCYTAWLKDPRLDYLEIPIVKNQKPPDFLQTTDMQKLLDQSKLEPLDMQIFIEAGLRLGLRLAEILQLDSNAAGETTIKVERKGGKLQSLPCPPELLEKLRSFNGFQFKELSYQMKLKRIAKRAGILSRVTPHVLRHSFATRAMKGKHSLAMIQKFLGHSNVETTMRYLHVETEDLRSLIE